MKNTVIFRIEFYLCKLLEYLILFSPAVLAKFFCVNLSRFVRMFLWSRRKLVLHNLFNVFKEKNPAEILYIAEQVWRNLGITLCEFVKGQKLNRKNIFKCVEFVNEDFLREAMDSKKGVLLLTCHLGNWEIMGMALSLSGYPLMVIARTLKNIPVDREINRIRRASGEIVVSEHAGVKESLRWLSRGGCIGILIDQHISEGGVIVDFLGRPAATSSIVALLAKKTGARILPLYNIRLPSGKIQVIFEKSFEINPGSDTVKETAKMSKIIAGWVRKHPEQWFWLHNRWKVERKNAIQS